MEVHAHTHTERKKWAHYFWEFLMLFLAVFCGFLAENQREHMVEHAREIKFAASLHEDLKKDTADFNSDIPFWESVLKRIDTLRMEIEKPAANRNTLHLYTIAGRMRDYNNFEYHERTIEQLKNAGNFRLIRKTTIADSLIDYDAQIKSELRDQEVQANVIYQTLNFLQDKLFNTKYFFLARSASSLDSVFKLTPSIFNVAAGKENDLFEYYNHLQFYRLMNQYRLFNTKILLIKATNLMELLTKEYHLK
ncbi:MAG TPA: hypothetical protein VFU29_19290 [Chitinophagaceae bacterium]|nr:hypothetical protein [Chitinophagaceae bacterium]